MKTTNPTKITEDKKVLCTHCKEAPVFVKICLSSGEVYWALECGCKTTPYARGQGTAQSTWESTTWSQTLKEAFDVAERETPSFIKILKPVHAT